MSIKIKSKKTKKKYQKSVNYTYATTLVLRKLFRFQNK